MASGGAREGVCAEKAALRAEELRAARFGLIAA